MEGMVLWRQQNTQATQAVSLGGQTARIEQARDSQVVHEFLSHWQKKKATTA